MELTKQGYDFIIDRIVNRKVEPPSGYTLNELGVYLTAYAKCQHDILDLIIRLRDENGR